jgi:hypothetical protein
VCKHDIPNKASLNNTTKQLSSDMKFLVWVLGEKLVLFEQIAQHAVEHLLQEKGHCFNIHSDLCLQLLFKQNVPATRGIN